MQRSPVAWARRTAPPPRPRAGGTGSSSARGRAGAPRPGGGRSPRAGRGARAAPAPTRSRPGPGDRLRPGRSRPRGRRRRGRRRGRGPARSSQKRSMSAGVIEGSPAASRARHQRTFITTSQSSGPPASRIRRRVPAELAVAVDQEREAEVGVGAPAPDRVELGRGVEARLVGLDDPEQAVAVEVAVGSSQRWWRGDPRLVGRIPDRDPPGPGEQRRLDRRGVARVAGRRRCRSSAAASPPGGPRRWCGR